MLESVDDSILIARSLYVITSLCGEFGAMAAQDHWALLQFQNKGSVDEKCLRSPLTLISKTTHLFTLCCFLVLHQTPSLSCRGLPGPAEFAGLYEAKHQILHTFAFERVLLSLADVGL